jgi:hypothetical protein
VDKVVELKKGALDGNYEEKSGKKKFADEANVAEAFLDGQGSKKKKGSKAPSGKAFKDEADVSAEVVKGKKGGGTSNEEDTGPKEEEKESNGYFNEDGEWIEGENPYGEEDQEEKEEDFEAIAAKKRAENDLIEQQM